MMRIIILALGLLGSVAVLAEEWTSPRWCGPERIPALIKEYEPNENAYTQYVFIGDALKTMGCLPPNVEPNK
jgi:hypothetical protein